MRVIEGGYGLTKPALTAGEYDDLHSLLGIEVSDVVQAKEDSVPSGETGLFELFAPGTSLSLHPSATSLARRPIGMHALPLRQARG